MNFIAVLWRLMLNTSASTGITNHSHMPYGDGCWSPHR